MTVIASIVIPFAVGFCGLVGASRFGRRVWSAAAVSLLPALYLAVDRLFFAAPLREARWRWVPGLQLEFSFRIDGLAALMMLIVSGIGITVMFYARDYFGAQSGHTGGLMCAFGAAMLGVVAADGLMTMFVFWELTSLTSFALIGTDNGVSAARAAARRALIVTGSGGLAMFVGFILLANESDSWSIHEVVSSGRTNSAAAVLILLGALTKSAIVPFQFWLPGAMAAPTPISTYLHSATMVKAGIFVLLRFSPLLASLGWWRPTIVALGLATMVVGGVNAIRQHDAKLLLAHGTVSQLGLMAVLAGFGTPAAAFAAIAMVIAHAAFKAPLFMFVGALDHRFGTRDLREWPMLRRAAPAAAWGIGLAGASMAALPPLAGFVAKEKGLDALLEHGSIGVVAAVGVAIGSVLTVVYTIRLAAPIWCGSDRTAEDHHPWLVALPWVWVAVGVVLGVVTPWFSTLTQRAAGTAETSLYLWHGFTPAFGLSAAVLIVGFAVSARWVPNDEPRRFSAARLFDRGYERFLNGCTRVTRITQSGSLPVYVGVAAVTATAALVVPLWRSGLSIAGMPIVNSGTEALLVVLICADLVLINRSTTRFSAVILLGLSGFLMAGLFLTFGGGDLAVTQFLVETLSMVAFVLTLQRFGRHFEPIMRSPLSTRLRAAIAAAFGIVFGLFALYVSGRPATPNIGDAAMAESLPGGGGRNVVNVTLVDFRGWDTMGEITVVAVAAIGVANLIAAAQTSTLQRLVTPIPQVSAATVARAITPLLLVVSLWITFRGHNAVGGGFAGGLIMGSVFAIRSLTLTPRSPSPTPFYVLAGGLLVAAGVTLAPVFFGREAMDVAIWKLHLPAVGGVKLITSTIFDLGVHAIVVGAVMALIQSLGQRPEPAT